MQSIQVPPRCKQEQRGLRGLLCRWPSITEWEMHITAQGPRLRNDLYCVVEWDVKLYYKPTYLPRTEPNRLCLGRIGLKTARSTPTRHVGRTTGKSISHARDVLWSTAVVHLWIVSIEVWPHLILIRNVDCIQWVKKRHTIIPITSPKLMLTNFQNAFTSRLSSKHIMKWSPLKIPPHLKHVATLPCVT